MQPSGEGNLVSIYPYLPAMGFASGVVVLGFCWGLVLFPFIHNYQGSLTYISQGMDMYCGWSGAVLGSCGMFIALCELVAALHTSRARPLLLAVLFQAPSWCIIVGVSGTGWGIHYTALAVLLCSTLFYHWVFASTHPLASATLFYQRTNVLTIVNALLFFMAFVMMHAGVAPSDSSLLLDLTVSLEVCLITCVTVQTFCVSWVLLQYQNIHIAFDARPYHY